MIHVIGDVHQPLHSCALFSEKYPTGDMGGNLFKVTDDNPSVKNLHSVWDSVFSKIQDGLKLPLNTQSEEVLDKYTEDIMKVYTRESLISELGDDFHFHDWLSESWKLCKEFVYVGISENNKIPQEYVEKGFEIAKHRMALAGYRVADILVKSYEMYLKAIRSGPGSINSGENLAFLQ